MLATLPAAMSPSPNSPTLRDVLRTLRTQLRFVSDAPTLESEWLIEHVTGFNRSNQFLNADNLFLPDQLEKINSLLSRRCAGEPLAYVLGEQYFWTLKLKISPAVLIPRPETELLVERALQHLPNAEATRALDLGTGSGAVALAVARERPLAQLIATDYSTFALKIAQENAVLNGVNNVSFLHSDWFKSVPPYRFDLILSNPPYIAEGDPHLEAAVLTHEPTIALLSGADGLTAIRQIIAQALGFLRPGGWLALEHGWQQAAAVRSLLESSGFCSVASHADLAGHERVTEAQAPAL